MRSARPTAPVLITLFTCLICLITTVAAKSDPIRLACVGDSITAGSGAPAGQSWPDVLGRLMGATYSVKNFGVGGTTMLKKGDSSYWSTQAFHDAQTFQPNIVIVMLGTNDTKPQNWDVHNADFADDTKSMLDTFKKLPSHPRVILALPIPVFDGGNYGIRKSVMDTGVQPALVKVAAQTKTETIDMYTAMQGHADQVGDNVHPTAAGYNTMAHYIFRYLTYGPEIEPAWPLFLNSTRVTIVPDAGADYTVYTTDGTDPTRRSPKYLKPFTVIDTTTIKSRTVVGRRVGDFVATTTVTKAILLSAQAVANPMPGLTLDLFTAPQDQLFASFNTLTHPTTSIEPQIDLPASVPATNFGLVYTGYVSIPEDNVYTFSTTSDDGSKLFIDGKLVVENWELQSPTRMEGSIALAAGYHAIRVEYFQGGGGDALSATYGSDRIPDQVIPASILWHAE